MTQASIETLLTRNRQYAKSHIPLPTVSEMVASGDDFERTIVVTCSDNRLNPEQFLQTQHHDGIIICRNPGGRVAPAIPAIMAFDAFVKLQNVVVLHHTDCGVTHLTNEGVRRFHKERLPDHPEIDEMDFGAFTDVEQSVRDDLEILKTSPYIPKALAKRSYGFIYDIKTGLLSQVV